MEWLPSDESGSEHADDVDQLQSLRDKEGKIIDTSEILNMTGVRELQQMERAREKLSVQGKKEPNNDQLILNKQILDIKIEQKIKMVRQSQLRKKAARSHR